MGQIGDITVDLPPYQIDTAPNDPIITSPYKD